MEWNFRGRALGESWGEAKGEALEEARGRLRDDGAAFQAAAPEKELVAPTPPPGHLREAHLGGQPSTCSWALALTVGTDYRHH